ncbi:MAG: ABC transporter permease [Pararhizobium sp.]|nr:ABC transporter permease [Pararhizobium sp.]
MVLAAPIFLLAVLNPVFRQPGNLFNLWQQSSIIGILAVGQTMVIILGGFDLSVGAVAALAGVVCFLGFGLEDGYIGVLAGLISALTVCALVGLVNGALITKLKMTPLIATLGVLSLARGAVLVVSDGQAIYAEEGAGYEFANFLQSSFARMPVSGLLFLAVAAIGLVLLRLTIYGQFVYAVGGNEKAATLAGIPVSKIKLITYCFCSVAAGLGGIVLASRTASALPNAGVNYELQAITAVVIGGAKLSGGKGSVLGTVLGVFLLAAIGNALNLYNISPFWQTGVTGAILILAVSISLLTGEDDRLRKA